MAVGGASGATKFLSGAYDQAKTELDEHLAEIQKKLMEPMPSQVMKGYVEEARLAAEEAAKLQTATKTRNDEEIKAQEEHQATWNNTFLGPGSEFSL